MTADLVFKIKFQVIFTLSEYTISTLKFTLLMRAKKSEIVFFADVAK